MIKISILVLGLVIVPNAKAQSEEYMEVGNGSCFLSMGKEQLKMASFNDHWSASTSYDALYEKISNLVLSKKYFNDSLVIKNINLGVHCGGYGSSFVANIESNLGDFCLWAKPSGNNFEVRSFGSIVHKSNSELCQGRKWGELIIGTNLSSVVEDLKAEKWSKIIKEISIIFNGTYKIVLFENYFLHEDEVRETILKDYKNGEIRYIEFNEYRHSVGEFVQIK